MTIKHLLSTLLLALLLTACNQSDPVSEEQNKPSAASDPVTTVYFNGDIVTMDEDQPTAEAVAIRGGKILSLGSKAEVQKSAGNNVTQRDLDGSTLLPGFIDAHGHITFTAQLLASANVSSPPVGKANNMDDVIRLLKEHADNTTDQQWITGWGYDDSLLAEKRHPTREDLDKVSTTRPIAIRHVSGHFMSCNSLCLKMAGINADMPDPDGGIIRRLGDSQEPDGVLEETAMGPLYTLIPQPTKEQQMEMLTKAQHYYAEHGITTVQDGATQLQAIEMIRAAAAQDLVFLDVVAFAYVLFLGDTLEQVKSSSDYKNNFRVGGVKLVLDGSPQGKTAWLTAPYLHPPHGQEQGYAGYATLKDEQVNSYIDQAFTSNIPVLAHANGDAAADQLINAVTTANEKHGKADRRTVMIHAQTVREDQIDSMIAQDIMPSYFSAHTFYWGDWHRDSVFGVERASRISPLRSSTDKGLRYTTHNDTPIVPPDMMRLMWASTNRITRSGKVLGPEQRATAMEALKSITSDAAHQYFEEASKGTISEGKNADLVIVAQNPLKVNPLEIKDIDVLETIKDGKTIFLK